MARISGLPRATWSNLESCSANPTLAVPHRVAGALQVSLEELLAAPRRLALLGYSVVLLAPIGAR